MVVRATLYVRVGRETAEKQQNLLSSTVVVFMVILGYFSTEDKHADQRDNTTGSDKGPSNLGAAYRREGTAPDHEHPDQKCQELADSSLDDIRFQTTFLTVMAVRLLMLSHRNNTLGGSWHDPIVVFKIFGWWDGSGKLL